MSTVQLNSNRAENNLVNGCRIVCDALADFAEIVENTGISRAEKDEIDAARMAYEAAQKFYCGLIRSKAAAVGVTPQTAPME
jgi:hypothetical protein